MRRVAVVPAAVHPPDVAHDELRLVVDRLQVGLRQHGRIDLHLVHDLVEAGAFVHGVHGALHQKLEGLGNLGQHAANPVA